MTNICPICGGVSASSHDSSGEAVPPDDPSLRNRRWFSGTVMLACVASGYFASKMLPDEAEENWSRAALVAGAYDAAITWLWHRSQRPQETLNFSSVSRLALGILVNSVSVTTGWAWGKIYIAVPGFLVGARIATPLAFGPPSNNAKRKTG